MRATTRVLVVVGRPASGEEAVIGEPLLGQLGANRVAMGVVTHHAHEPDLGAERGDIGGDIGGAAQGHAGLAHVHHGDRRLGRQSVGVAEQVAVEHDVAHDHDALSPRSRREVRDPFPRQSRTGKCRHLVRSAVSG